VLPKNKIKTNKVDRRVTLNKNYNVYDITAVIYNFKYVDREGLTWHQEQQVQRFGERSVPGLVEKLQGG
jgi:hypothetical protein